MTDTPLIVEPTMVCEDKTARQLYEAVKANPARARFGFGERLAVVNIDFQQAYTRPDLYPKTAYVTDSDQIGHTNRISAAARAAGMPVIWTHVAYKADAGDAGVWGTRTATPSTRGSRSTTPLISSSPSACRAPSSKQRSRVTSSGTRWIRW
jgi:maleamate amidohydrolase